MPAELWISRGAFRSYAVSPVPTGARIYDAVKQLFYVFDAFFENYCFSGIDSARGW